jgi:hypothetical protein
MNHYGQLKPYPVRPRVNDMKKVVKRSKIVAARRETFADVETLWTFREACETVRRENFSEEER